MIEYIELMIIVINNDGEYNEYNMSPCPIIGKSHSYGR
jgi:hypothetical protein